MRTGFLARTGLALGPLAVSFGFGGGVEIAPTRVAEIYLSDAALTQIVATAEVSGNDEVEGLALVTVTEELRTDVRASHAPKTVIELEDEA